jgi:hypothetical protein
VVSRGVLFDHLFSLITLCCLGIYSITLSGAGNVFLDRVTSHLVLICKAGLWVLFCTVMSGVLCLYSSCILPWGKPSPLHVKVSLLLYD